MIDTGADISVVPPNKKIKPSNSSLCLYAANGTKIETFGTKRLSLSLGLRRDLQWNFVIADVNCPIIGADFLRYYGLLVDVRRRMLIDNDTKLENKRIFIILKYADNQIIQYNIRIFYNCE